MPTVAVRVGRNAEGEYAAETEDGQMWHITKYDIIGGLVSLVP